MDRFPTRFHSLDVLRGLAALSVVLWHWQHFFYEGTLLGPFRPECQPLYGFFFLFYREGHRAVDLFFSLSGFVFFWLYAQPISERTVTCSKFFWLRFSRLYPLHIVTLVVVAGLQTLLIKWTGTAIVYSWNDLYHLILNLFFVSGWGLERGASFNGPAWSVSVEVALYACFYLFCRVVPVKAQFLIGAVACGAFLERVGALNIGRGIFAFFMGGCVYLVYRGIRNTSLCQHVARVTVFVTATMWGFTIIHLSGVFHADLFLMRVIQKNGNLWVGLIFFPLTILALALMEETLHPLTSRLSFIGDLTYSSYLIHFPLQLLFIIVMGHVRVGKSVFYSSGMFVLYFIVLITVSLATYRYFELPAQRTLRAMASRPVARGKEEGVA